VTLTADFRDAVVEIGAALRRPEAFARRWRDRVHARGPTALVFPVLLANAAFGLAVFGLVLGLHRGGLVDMLDASVGTTLACGLPWLIALPALYIINSALGSKLDASTTTLAGITTVSFGALALLAAVPVKWFFSLALDYPTVHFVVNSVIFSAVAISMADVFLRVMRALEPERGRAYAFTWLCLVGVLSAEMAALFQVTQL
jgi:hypothetical protein